MKTKMIERFVPCISLMTLALLTGCMTTKREEEMQANMRQMQDRVVELEKQLQAKDRSIDTVKSEAEDTHRRVQGTTTELEEMKRDIALTQGAVDELRVKLSRVQEVSAKSKEESAPAAPASTVLTDEHLSDIARRASLAQLEVHSLSEMHNEHHKKEKSTKIKTPAEVTKALADAFVKKDYKKVVSISTGLLNSDLPDAAQEVALEFRAEAYFAMQDYAHAALDFSKFSDRYPKSDKLPRALLLTGDSFVYLKQPLTARSYYSDCIKKAPNREECKASKERLDRLGV